MRFRKAILTEALNLSEYLPRKLLLVPPLAHAGDQLVLESAKATAALPGCHGAPQLIGLAGRETRGNDGELHDLLLENRHAQRALQNTFDGIAGVLDGFLAISAAQVGMHHVSLNRARPDDRHLDNQVVITAGPEPRQHRHLSP